MENSVVWNASMINRDLGETHLKQEVSLGAVVKISRSSPIFHSCGIFYFQSFYKMHFNKASLLATAALISEVAAIPTLQSRATAGRLISTLTVVNVCLNSLVARLRRVPCPPACR